MRNEQNTIQKCTFAGLYATHGLWSFFAVVVVSIRYIRSFKDSSAEYLLNLAIIASSLENTVSGRGLVVNYANGQTGVDVEIN